MLDVCPPDLELPFSLPLHSVSFPHRTTLQGTNGLTELIEQLSDFKTLFEPQQRKGLNVFTAYKDSLFLSSCLRAAAEDRRCLQPCSRRRWE